MNTKEIEEFEKDLKDDYTNLLKQQGKIEEEEKEINKSIKFFTRLGWIGVISGLVPFVLGIIIILFINSWKEHLNAFGSFVGGSVASFWSLAGLFFIYVAFLGQKLQLMLQQLEMKFSQYEVKSTRLELLGQKEQMIEQNKTLKQQRFENSFFQMVNLYSETVTTIEVQIASGYLAKGRGCFLLFYNKVQENIEKANHGYNPPIKQVEANVATIEQTIDGYHSFYLNERNKIGHYFRTLYHIVKFIDNSDIEDKKTYIGLIRAQLSTYELLLLFYNCLSDFGSEKFKPLIEKYTLLKSMNTDLVFNREHLMEYEKTAFTRK